MGAAKGKAAVSTTLAFTLAFGAPCAVPAFADEGAREDAVAEQAAETVAAAEDAVVTEGAPAEGAAAESRGLDALAEGAALDAGAAEIEAGASAPSAEEREANVEASLAATRATGLVTGLSDEFKYFTKYESACNYDQGFSYGDGYHALGYYQFDNRYSLQPFLEYCYRYDPATFSMFAFVEEPGFSTAGTIYDYGLGRLTDLGRRLEDAWHAAYAAAPGTFAALQDTYAYNNYYVVAENYLASRGIDISTRADCVRGLCWGVCNLFGSGGWVRFVGGTYAGVYYEGCGLSNDMSDAEFAVALTQYIVDHVAEFYPSQPQYHEGWQNRYRNEQRECLSYLPDLVPGAWYQEAVDYVRSTGMMSGYSGGAQAGRFGPDDRITRGQIATVLYRWFTGGADDAYYASLDLFSDVPDGAYYEAAVNWACQAGIVSGYGDGSAYGPDDYATREQTAVIMSRAASVYGQDTSSNSGAIWGMVDVAQVSSYALPGMAWCYDQGILSGYVEPDGTVLLNPQNTCTRAQFAKMAMVLTRDVL